ncbi:MAG TPA: TIGR00725 family protein [Longimicrobiales bacterium]|nr:TIGR00725 family protein [Longimicrobiales bacterium]
MTPAVRIAVCGPGNATAGEAELAREVGALLAEAGAVLICGGLGGAMEAAARGAASRGGLTVGVLPGNDSTAANPYIVLPLPTGMGEMRNALVVRFADAVIAVGGGWGTLSEVALAMKTGKPVVLLAPDRARDLPVPEAADAADAVRLALDAAARRTGHA